jgi:hypothetical protein
MPQFRCDRFPDGVAHIRTPSGRVVDFIDGHATVSEELAVQLRQVPAEFELTEMEAEGEKLPASQPAKRASRPRKR